MSEVKAQQPCSAPTGLCKAEHRRPRDHLRAADERSCRKVQAQRPNSPAIHALRASPGPHAEHPERIDQYRLIRQIGQGSGSIVYLAEQVRPVQRQVALKIIKLGMDTREVVARFEGERQTLALMEHPNIAQVLDAGATFGGRPYFVMELVRGLKITDYCDQQRLSITARLELFLQVCQAIQHAHQQGIIHRDIKPSNVLVAQHDQVPRVKVIDFGIAKATHARLTQATIHTALDDFVGTPAYMSPEQAQPGTAANVDARTDIYSLGMLLYELLAGCTPLGFVQIPEAKLPELLRQIRADEPLAPSQRLRSLPAEQIAKIVACRACTLHKVTQQLRGDLDWIVMRCLARERTRRYQTVHELILELQRYLRHETVSARPQRMAYGLRKFARRHPLLFATALVGVALLVLVSGGAAMHSIQQQRIASEHARAERVSKITLQMLATAEQFQDLDQGASALSLLDQAARSAEEELSGHPELRAQLFTVIGIGYRRRDNLALARKYLEQAVDILQRRTGDPAITVSALAELVNTRRFQGDLADAERVTSQAFNLAQKHRLQDSAAYATLLLEHGRNELLAGRISAAHRSVGAALLLTRRLHGSRSIQTAEALLTLSQVSLWGDDLHEAELTAREALAIYDAIVSDMHPDRTAAATRLGYTLYLRRRLAEAEPFLLQALQERIRLFGADSPRLNELLSIMAELRQSQGRLAEAEEFARQALTNCRSAFGEEQETTAQFRTFLAMVLLSAAKYHEAEQELRHALRTFVTVRELDERHVASAQYLLADVLLRTNRLSEALALFTASIERLQRAGASAWRSARSASGLGETLHRLGRSGEAEAHLTQGYLTLARSEGVDLETLSRARARVAQFYIERQQLDRLHALDAAVQANE